MVNSVDSPMLRGFESVPFRCQPLSTLSIVRVAILLLLCGAKVHKHHYQRSSWSERAAVRQTMAQWNYLS